MAAGETATTPFVRVVVVNYNGGDYVTRCFEHLRATDWPADALDLVLVDNGSNDDSTARIAEGFPNVRIVRNSTNLGFAGGNNVAMKDLSAVNYVALVNADAFVAPGWLRPLVEAAEADDQVGAVNPKIVFDDRFVEIEIETAPYRPGGHDDRLLGVRVWDVTRGGQRCWDRVVFGSDFFALERDPSGRDFRWSQPSASLLAPIGDDQSMSVAVTLDAASSQSVRLTVGASSIVAELEPGRPQAVEVPIAADVDTHDVINSAGCELLDDGLAVDRGYGQPDGGGFDTPTEVFAWTGATVLLKRAYLEDVGTFDPTFFLYSEDIDLAWRGRLRGWKHLYCPGAAVRHVRSAIVGDRSAVADYYAQRNALLTLAKNAPANVARGAAARYVADTRQFLRFEIARPLLRLRRPRPQFSGRRLRVLAGFVVRLPGALRRRRLIGRTATADRAALYERWT